MYDKSKHSVATENILPTRRDFKLRSFSLKSYRYLYLNNWCEDPDQDSGTMQYEFHVASLVSSALFFSHGISLIDLVLSCKKRHAD
jgi:hypothetical protein